MVGRFIGLLMVELVCWGGGVLEGFIEADDWMLEGWGPGYEAYLPLIWYLGEGRRGRGGRGGGGEGQRCVCRKERRWLDERGDYFLFVVNPVDAYLLAPVALFRIRRS